MLLSFEQALQTVQEKVSGAKRDLPTEILPLEQIQGRVLAEDVMADRDYPPFHRSTRDGFAVRSADLRALPALLESAGELHAGQSFSGKLGPGQCVQIMTGAPLPAGADAVAMVEHTRAEGSRVDVLRCVEPFENVVRQGSEAAAGSPVLRHGRRLGTGEMGLLASVGQASVKVFRRPHVAIITTGDEVVPFNRKPEWFQIRNSNAVILAAQVMAAGGVPRQLGIVPDEKQSLRHSIEQGLTADLLLVSGGVSVGKYDLVKETLSTLGAEFHFHGVAIRPGKPLLFGRAREKFFFGLPGNPVSTWVTSQLFVRPTVGALSGTGFAPPLFLRARLGRSLSPKADLTMFVPARVHTEDSDPVVRPVSWQGSGDLVGMAAANCLIVVHPEQTKVAVGDWVDILCVLTDH